MIPSKKTVRFDESTIMMREEVSSDGSGDQQVLDKTNLIVNYIPQETSEEDLAALFQSAGEIESVKIIKHLRTGYSFGYGFVKFVNEENATQAIDLFNGFNYRNKVLKVSYSRPQGSKNCNLFISNLPRGFTEENLINVFGKYGEIIQKNLLRDKETGFPKGCAFVRYSSTESAQTAINDLNGGKLENCVRPICVRLADDRGKPARPRWENPRSQRNNYEMFNYQAVDYNLQHPWMPGYSCAGDYPFAQYN